MKRIALSLWKITCNDVSQHLEKIGYSGYTLGGYRLFINISERSLKCVLLNKCKIKLKLMKEFVKTGNRANPEKKFKFLSVTICNKI